MRHRRRRMRGRRRSLHHTTRVPTHDFHHPGDGIPDVGDHHGVAGVITAGGVRNNPVQQLVTVEGCTKVSLRNKKSLVVDSNIRREDGGEGIKHFLLY